MDREAAARWLVLDDQANEVFIMWHRIKHRQIAATFWTWYLRLIRERSDLGLASDEAWKLLKSKEVINA